MQVFGCQIVEQLKFFTEYFKNLTTNVSVKKVQTYFQGSIFNILSFIGSLSKFFEKKMEGIVTL